MSVFLSTTLGRMALTFCIAMVPVLELRGAEREVPGYADYLVVHQERWAEALDACDQAYNSNLSLERGSWVCR